MKLDELKKEIQKYQYFDDTNIINFSIACIISNRLRLTDPVWSIIIGASSGGKSQILRPLTLTDTNFIHKVDDLTENTFLSGAKVKDGEDDNSLLHKIGSHGILSISDLTVLLSKSKESKDIILSQFRLLFDGEMTKYSGNRSEPITWKGYLGVMAGATPAIYSVFEDVSVMGERFVYYRMKEFDRQKATELALSRDKYGKELDSELSDKYGEYIKEVIMEHNTGVILDLPKNVMKRIIEVANFAEIIRTTSHTDFKGNIDRIPVSAYPMRVALQLTAIAKALMIMKNHDEGTYQLDENDLSIIDWVGYSLANEEKRSILHILARGEFGKELTTQAVADEIGLNTVITQVVLQNLAAVGILKRQGSDIALTWKFADKEHYDLVRRIEKLDNITDVPDRDATFEDF